MANQDCELGLIKAKHVRFAIPEHEAKEKPIEFTTIIRNVTIIIVAVGWCVLIFFTIKSAFEHNEIEASEVQGINNIAGILYKLANINMFPISNTDGPKTGPNEDLIYIYKYLNGKNESETSPNLLFSRKSGVVGRG